MRALAIVVLMAALVGCATTQETTQLRSNLSAVQMESSRQQTEVHQKVDALGRDVAGLRQQVLSLTAATDGHDDRLRIMLGRIDELSHRLDRLQEEVKKAAEKKREESAQAAAAPPRTTPQMSSAEYEAQYKSAFEAFQKGDFQKAGRLFREFIESTPETELRPKAFYWLGESYIHTKEYDKAILSFQEISDKYPKNDVAPKALLSQAEAFSYSGDGKSAETVLKKIIDRYPKSEEASMAERRLKNVEPSQPKTAEKPRPAAPEKGRTVAVVTAEAANLRVSPSLASRQALWVVKGTVLTVLDEATEAGGRKWYKVRTKAGKEGWITDRLVKLQEEREAER